LNETADSDAEGSGELDEGIEGDVHKPTFDFAQVFVTQPGFFSEFFLGKTGAFPVKADFLAQNSTVTH